MFYYRYQYFPAPQPIPFQGTLDELRKKLKETGLVVVGGSNGSYVLGGFAYGIIYEFPDKKSSQPIRSVIPNKDMLLIRYSRERISKNIYAMLVDELNNGVISFDSL